MSEQMTSKQGRRPCPSFFVERRSFHAHNYVSVGFVMCAHPHMRSSRIQRCGTQRRQRRVLIAPRATLDDKPPQLEKPEDELKERQTVWQRLLELIVRLLGSRPAMFISGLVSGAILASVVLIVDLEGSAVGNSLRDKVTLFDMIMQDISRNYVEPVDEERLFETGVNAMLGSLDPYTQFENMSEAREIGMKTMGKYGGVGLGISSDLRDPRRLVVVSAFEGYAYDTGLRPGDYIDTVDGLDVSGKSLESVTEMLRGAPGTSVDVSVAREGAPKPLNFRLNRRYINLRDVPVAAVLDKTAGIGYIRLQSFAKDAAGELRAAVASLSRSTKLSGIVLDLRGNPGGLLNSAVEVAEVLLPKGSVIVSTKGRALGDTQNYVSARDPVLPAGVRVAVLVNGQTASAAEIVAGAVQDLDVGVVVGSRTFGKGLIQNIQELPFRTALRYTVGRYYTPSGRCIQAIDYSSEKGTLTGKEKQDQERLAFRTQNGRIVKDGGGIDVDVYVKSVPPSELESSLMSQGMFFYFANKLAAELQWTVPPNFSVSDDMYKSFVEFVDKSNFKQQSRFDDALEKLQGLLEEEGYNGAGQEMNVLRSKISEEIRVDFVRHRPEIQRRIEQAIRLRTQPDSERLLIEAKNDEQVLQSIEVLKNRDLYTQLLAPPSEVKS